MCITFPFTRAVVRTFLHYQLDSVGLNALPVRTVCPVVTVTLRLHYALLRPAHFNAHPCGCLHCNVTQFATVRVTPVTIPTFVVLRFAIYGGLLPVAVAVVADSTVTFTVATTGLGLRRSVHLFTGLRLRRCRYTLRLIYSFAARCCVPTVGWFPCTGRLVSWFCHTVVFYGSPVGLRVAFTVTRLVPVYTCHVPVCPGSVPGQLYLLWFTVTLLNALICTFGLVPGCYRFGYGWFTPVELRLRLVLQLRLGYIAPVTRTRLRSPHTRWFTVGYTVPTVCCCGTVAVVAVPAPFPQVTGSLIHTVGFCGYTHTHRTTRVLVLRFARFPVGLTLLLVGHTRTRTHARSLGCPRLHCGYCLPTVPVPRWTRWLRCYGSPLTHVAVLLVAVYHTAPRLQVLVAVHGLLRGYGYITVGSTTTHSYTHAVPLRLRLRWFYRVCGYTLPVLYTQLRLRHTAPLLLRLVSSLPVILYGCCRVLTDCGIGCCGLRSRLPGLPLRLSTLLRSRLPSCSRLGWITRLLVPGYLAVPVTGSHHCVVVNIQLVIPHFTGSTVHGRCPCDATGGWLRARLAVLPASFPV